MMLLYLLPTLVVICMTTDAHRQDHEEIQHLKTTIAILGKQMMADQLANEERARTAGDSGLTQVRLRYQASSTYLTESHVSLETASIHDHSDYIRLVGLGELVVNLNGVEFRTRHNDYSLVMPSKDNSSYHATEDIPLPDVPPEVLDKTTVDEEIEEMKLWFKAFDEQDYTERDYRKYFKPVLCYVEGAWLFVNRNKVEEPFPSDRHHLNATSWKDLEEKIRFSSATGTKDSLENLAFLPTTIADMGDDGITPRLAQWNYRQICHPLKHDLPTSRFRQVDDFASRMIRQFSMFDQAHTRSARFQLNPQDYDTWNFEEFRYISGLLDDIVSEIPGLDNYPASLVDDAMDLRPRHINGSPLNAGYYHRGVRIGEEDAFGFETLNRGFNDQSMFVAMNTQDNVMPVKYYDLKKKKEISQKVSYMIPLEIIYMTPLQKWNPYNLLYRGTDGTPEAEAVTANGRDGSVDKPLDGMQSRFFYQTPHKFFNGVEVRRTPADSSHDVLTILDQDDVPRNVSPSGIRILLPPIADLGSIRTRYPIFPIHDEGSSTRKELEAVKRVLLEIGHYIDMLKVPLPSNGQKIHKDMVLHLDKSTDPSIHAHTSDIILTPAEQRQVWSGQAVTKTTESAAGVTHTVKLQVSPDDDNFVVLQCDGDEGGCGDGHPAIMQNPPDIVKGEIIIIAFFNTCFFLHESS